MPPTSLSVQRQIMTIIKKFKFEELESMVLPHFPETSWSEVRSKLVKHHDSFTSTNVIRIIEQAINNKKINNKELRERLTLLEVIEVSRHSKKKNWYGYELKEKKSGIILMSLDELREKMIHILHTMKINMEVKLLIYDGITFIAMRDKKSIRLTPLFFALFMEQGYFFSSRKIITKTFLHVITESTGYSDFKKLKLTGKHLKSLIKMLQMKRQGVTHAKKLYNSFTYKEASPIIKNTGIDFRQHRQRKQHIENIFGDEQPTINVLIVKNSNVPWVNKDFASKLSNIQLNLEWEFKSHDILKLLGELAEKRVLTNPLPNYVTELMESGKNELKIKNS